MWLYQSGPKFWGGRAILNSLIGQMKHPFSMGAVSKHITYWPVHLGYEVRPVDAGER